MLWFLRIIRADCTKGLHPVADLYVVERSGELAKRTFAYCAHCGVQIRPTR